MSNLPGVYKAQRKNGQIYYRSSITYSGKHISLGSYNSKEDAHSCYILASEVLRGHNKFHIDDFPTDHPLPFQKWVIIVNYRNNGIYFRNPIYLMESYFIYHIDINTLLKFDVDDLFYYSHNKISKRGGYLYITDYGMHINLLSRYGIKNYAIEGKDYKFMNGDSTDYRYSNIEVINPYHGVTREGVVGRYIYVTKININGEYIVGRYSTDVDAAIAYNKAQDILREKGFHKNFTKNYIPNINEIEYASIYQRLRISENIRFIEL